MAKRVPSRRLGSRNSSREQHPDGRSRSKNETDENRATTTSLGRVDRFMSKPSGLKSAKDPYPGDAVRSRGRVVDGALDGLACGDRGEGNSEDGSR